jgi:hypothetical protein
VTIVTVTGGKTLGDLKTRIADELARSDLTSQIALAIDDAIDLASTHRFWFNEVRGLQLNLNYNQAYYTNSDIAALQEIDNLYLLLNGTFRRNLYPAGNDRLDVLNNGSIALGEPMRYSRYGQEIRFWPIPGSSYTVYIDGLTQGEPMEDDTDSSIWTTYGEKLIRALAKRTLYAEVIRNKDLALANEQLAEAYLHDLVIQTEQRNMTGAMEVFGV